MLVYKSSANSKFFSALSLPSFMRDWLVMRFSDEQGNINKDEVSAYVKRVIPKKSSGMSIWWICSTIINLQGF